MLLISKGLAKEVLESNKKEKSQHFVCLELQIIEIEQQGFYLLYRSLNWKERCGQGPVLQNVIPIKGETKFAGAAVIKGKTKS